MLLLSKLIECPFDGDGRVIVQPYEEVYGAE